jgi:hypothetical protein
MKQKASLDEIIARALQIEAPLEKILMNKEVAKLGDAYLNFIYSLARSIRDGRIVGEKISNRILAEAIRSSGLRSLLPQRLSRREIGGAAEAIITYSVAKGLISTDECLKILEETTDPVLSFTLILRKLKEKYKNLNNSNATNNP